MEIYVVYEEYQDERLTTGDMDFFANKEEAIDEFNSRKEDFQYNDEWELSDEFDAEDVTDSDNAVLFIHKTTGLEAYVNIETIKVQ